MNAYAVSAPIRPTGPRICNCHAERRMAPIALSTATPGVCAEVIDLAPTADRTHQVAARIRDRWWYVAEALRQQTFYLSDAESWR